MFDVNTLRLLRVRESLYPDVKARVLNSIPTLRPDLDYTAEQMYGPAAWAALEKGEKLLAGSYLAWMVSTGQLPLQLADTQFPRNTGSSEPSESSAATALAGVVADP